MSKPASLSSNFAHLREHDEQLLRLGMLVERINATKEAGPAKSKTKTRLTSKR